MSVLLFRLNGVPEDEAREVRELLDHNDIPFYETHAGNWGFGTAAIWLKDERTLRHAQRLLDEYQIARTRRMREEYARLARDKQMPTLLRQVKERPLLYLVSLVIITAVLYFSIKPFLDFGK